MKSEKLENGLHQILGQLRHQGGAWQVSCEPRAGGGQGQGRSNDVQFTREVAGRARTAESELAALITGLFAASRPSSID